MSHVAARHPPGYHPPSSSCASLSPAAAPVHLYIIHHHLQVYVSRSCPIHLRIVHNHLRVYLCLQELPYPLVYHPPSSSYLSMSPGAVLSTCISSTIIFMSVSDLQELPQKKHANNMRHVVLPDIHPDIIHCHLHVYLCL